VLDLRTAPPTALNAEGEGGGEPHLVQLQRHLRLIRRGVVDVGLEAALAPLARALPPQHHLALRPRPTAAVGWAGWRTSPKWPSLP